MRTMITITLPNGVEVESELKSSGRPCLLCGEPAMRYVFPKFENIQEEVIDHLCQAHLDKMWDLAEKATRESSQ